MKAKKGMVAKAIIGGRTVRPCDVCLRERARWYCAADEAYLCDRCDGSVHSANSVARRHERVRFEAGCAKLEADLNGGLIFCGARKRARSSRPHPHGSGQRSVKSKLGVRAELAADPPAMAVPEDSSAGEFNLNLRVDDDDYDDDDDELLPQVPTFVPMAEELCGSTRMRDVVECPVVEQYKGGDEIKGDCGGADLGSCDFDQFLNSETDLSGFGVDMDMDVDSIIEGLGVLGFPNSNWDDKRILQLRDLNERINDGSKPDQREDGDNNGPTGWLNSKAVKAEDDEDRSYDLCSKPKEEGNHHAALKAKLEPEPDQSWDTIELDLDQYHEDEEDQEFEDATGFGDQYCMVQADTDDQRSHDYEDIKIKPDPDSILIGGETMYSERKMVSLSLNYEDVLTAWSDRGSPWASLPDCNSEERECHDSGIVPDLGLSYSCGQLNIMEGGGLQEDSCRHGGCGREARVLRYREKRRTRLFSKKIRYEVRKLNAEKRPRMKGRFVKRTPGMFCD